MSRVFKILQKELVVETPHFQFFKLRVQSDDKEKTFPRLVHRSSVIIIPVSLSGRTAILRQFRFGTGKEYWEFCAGGIDAGEDGPTTAIRELNEEMGLTVSSVHLVGEYDSAPHSSVHHVSVYYADISDVELDRLASPVAEDEIIETRIVTFGDIDEMIDRGEFQSDEMLAAYCLFCRYLAKQRGHK